MVLLLIFKIHFCVSLLKFEHCVLMQYLKFYTGRQIRWGNHWIHYLSQIIQRSFVMVCFNFKYSWDKKSQQHGFQHFLKLIWHFLTFINFHLHFLQAVSCPLFIGSWLLIFYRLWAVFCNTPHFFKITLSNFQMLKYNETFA